MAGKHLPALRGGAIAIGVAASASAAMLLGMHRYLDAIAMLVATGLAMAGAAVMAVRQSGLNGFESPFSRADPIKPTTGQTLTPEQVDWFVRAILYPSTVTSRIRESLEPMTRAMQVRTSYTFRAPETFPDPLYLPITLARKGTLFDDLQIMTEDGGECPSLSYSEYLSLVATVLRQLIALANEDAFDEYTRHLEDELLEYISDRAPKNSSDASSARKLLSRLQTLTGKSAAGRLSVNLANKLIFQYPIVVPVPPSGATAGWIVLRTVQRRLLPLDSPNWRWLVPMPWLLDRARKLLGVRPSAFNVSLETAILTSSYHLEFMGPPGTYLARQEVTGIDAGGRSYIRMRRRLGQRYAHLYMREASRRKVRQVLDARLRMHFFERMPGSMGPASVSAVSAFVLLCIASSLDNAGGGQRGDIIAVLLAFPGIVAAWIGLERPGGPIGGSMAARLSSLLTVLATLIGTASYFGVITDGADWISELSIGYAKGNWVIIVGIAALNAIWTSYSWIRRSYEYSAILGRDDPTIDTTASQVRKMGQKIHP